MSRKEKIKDISIEKKNIIYRIDIDCSLGPEGFFMPHKVARYKETFQYFIEKKAKVAVLFEVGENRVRWKAKPPIEKIRRYLAELLEISIHYAKINSEKEVEYALEEILPGEILFLENLAIGGEENQEDAFLFEKLEKWGELYIFDAPALEGRNYYSLTTLPHKKETIEGDICQREKEKLERLFSEIEHPFTILLGGLDIELFFLENIASLLEKADQILFTGAWTSYFTKTIEQVEKEEWMNKKLLKVFEKNIDFLRNHSSLYFPSDVKVYKKYPDQTIKVANVPIDFIKTGLKIGDIGEETIQTYSEILEKSEFILWIGSIGKWWKNGLSDGTKKLYELVSRRYISRIVAGDDLLESFFGLGLKEDRFSYAHFGDGRLIMNYLLDKKE